MLEILQFIFSDFWHWSGTVILILVAGVSLNAAVVGLRGSLLS